MYKYKQGHPGMRNPVQNLGGPGHHSPEKQESEKDTLHSSGCGLTFRCWLEADGVRRARTPGALCRAVSLWQL